MSGEQGLRDGSIFLIRTDGGVFQPADVQLTKDAVAVRLAGFYVQFPRLQTHARRVEDEPAPGGPTADRHEPTRWKFTTSTRGLVELSCDVPAPGGISLGVVSRQIQVSSLLISVQDPEGLVAALRGTGDQA